MSAPRIRIIPCRTRSNGITVERQIGEFAFSISYIGTHGTALLYERNLNEPAPSTIPFTKSRYLLSPAFNNVNWFTNGGNEQYNGLQVAVTKTMGKNLYSELGLDLGARLDDRNRHRYGHPEPV